MSHEQSTSSRTRKESLKIGRYVTPEQSSDPSSLQNVLGFIQDYIPQSYSTGTSKIEREKVVWARFETTDCNDLTQTHHHDRIDDSAIPLVLLIGLTNGFSVWMILPGSDAREVFTYQNDPVKMASILQTPQNSKDTFKEHRPLIALVKKSNNSRSLFSSLVFVSLSKSDSSNGREVKRIEFEKNTIIDIKLNKRVMVVVLQKRLVVLDAASLEQRFVIKTGHVSTESWTNPVALGTRWIALSDTVIHKHLLSVGGVSEHLAPPVVSTVVNTVRKGFAAISDTISGFTGRGVASGPQIGTVSPESGIVAQTPPLTGIHPVVTVLNLHYQYTSDEIRLNELRRSEGVLAHFLAHSSSDVFITTLSFNKSGELLFTADSEGQCFNIFKILNNGQSDATTVQHLYSLYRGSTPGKVQDVCFSNDSRWVGVSTLNGTTHIFPISTYGGSCTVRTHMSPQVVNQLTRFHTSAGIGPLQSGPAPNPTVSTPCSSFHSNSQQLSSTHNGVVIPLIVTPLQQIKQSYSSGTASGSSSSSSNNNITSSTVSVEEKTSFNTCIKAVFTAVHARSDYTDQGVQYSLYTVNGQGELMEYLLTPRRSNNTSSTGSNSNSTGSGAASVATPAEDEEGPIDLMCSPKLKWKLLSKIMEDTVPLPLGEDNPLIMAYNELKEFTKISREVSNEELNEKWLSEVELLTYAPPTRRLWMGPQFTFKTFSEDRSDYHNEGLDTTTPILQPTYEVSELMGVSHFELNSIHTNPMSLSANTEKGRGHSETDSEGVDTGVEVFGSWKDIAPKLKTIKSNCNLEQQILDAMKDGGVSSPNPSPVTTLDKKPVFPLYTAPPAGTKTQIGFNPS